MRQIALTFRMVKIAGKTVSVAICGLGTVFSPVSSQSFERSRVNKQINRTKRINLAPAVLAAVLASSGVHAHTISIGYENAGNNTLSFWYGTYHSTSEANYNEGSMTLSSTNGYSQTLAYNLLTTTKPAGLVDGSTNFYSGGSASTLQATNTYGSAVDAWQGRTFSGLSAGTYTFTYVPIANPTQVWAPINSAILSSTVTVITADLNNTAPRLTAGMTVDQTQVSDPIIFEGGMVQPTADATLANVVSVDNPGGVIDTAGHNLTLSGAIDGRGVLTKTGDGTLSLTGTNTSIGGVALNGGAVNVASDANLGAASGGLTFNGGALQLGSSFDLSPTRSITLNTGGGTIDTQQYNTQVSQGISGTGDLTKAGSGTLTLSGANTYTGATNVAQGTLQAGANNTLSQQSAVNVAQGADLNLNGFNQTVGSLAGAGTVDLGSGTLAAGANGASTSFSGTIYGTGGLNKQGAGTLALSGANTYSGGTAVNGGTLEIGSDINLGDASGALTLNGGTLHTTGNVAGTRNIALAGNGTINTDAGTAMANSGTVSGAGGLVKNGAGTLELDGVASHQGGTTVNSGTLILSGTNTYTGGSTVNAGSTLQVGSDANLGDASSGLTLNGGTLHTTGNVAGTRNIALAGNGTINTDAGTAMTNSGTVSGAGGLVKNGAGTLELDGVASHQGGTTVNSGTLILSGTNTYTGGTTVNTDGTLQIASDNGLGNPSGNVLLNGGTLHTTGNVTSARNITVAADSTVSTDASTAMSDIGVISGTGDLTKAGSGTLTLSGANTYTGATNVAQGTLQAGANNTLSQQSAVNVAQGADLNLNGFNQTVGSLAGAGTVDLGSGTLAAGANGASTSFSGTIYGTGGLNKQGAGTLALSGANTYSGGTAVNGGTLEIGSDINLGDASGALTLNGGTLHTTGNVAGTRNIALAGNGTINTDAGTAMTNSGTVSGAGGLVKNGAGTLELDGVASHQGGTTVNNGTLILSGTNTYTGGSTVNAGSTLQVGSDANLGDASSGLTLNGGTLHTTGNVAGTRNIALAGNGTINTDAGTAMTNSGTVSGAGGLVKNGAGTLELDGVASHQGGTTVNSGTLILSGANTYTGGSTVNAGSTLQVGSDANLGDASSGLTLNGGTLHTTGNVAGTRNIALAGNGTINTDAGTAMTNSGTVSGAGGLVKNGAGTLELDGVASHQGGTTVNNGTLILSGTNTYTGGTTLNGGSLHISSDQNLGDASNAIDFHGGDLTVTSSMTTSRNMNIGAEGASLTTLNGVTLVEQGNLTGIGGLQKNGDGTLIVSGNNTFTGGTLINGGVIQIDSGSSLGTGAILLKGGTLNTVASLGTGQQIIVSGASGINVDTGTTAVLSGQLVASGDASCFTKTGKGTLNMTGSAALPNGTCVADGILRANGALDSNVQVYTQGTLRGVGIINGPVSVTGKLAPGNSPGTLIVNGTVTMNNGSTFEEDIDGTGTGTGAGSYSRVLVQGAGHQFVANGTLQPLLRGIPGDASNTYTPNVGETFRIVTADGGVIGRFAGLTQPVDGLLAGTRLQAFYNVGGSNSIDLRVTPLSYASGLTSGNANVQALGGLLDRTMVAQDAGATSDRQSQFLYAVSAASNAQLAAVAKGLAGEVHADMAAAAPEAARATQKQISEHLTSGPAADLGHSEMLWANVTHSNDHTSSDEYATGFTARSNQVTVGADVIRSGTTRMGLGFSHADTNVSTDGGGGSIQENLGFIYGQHAAGTFLIDGTFGYGAQSWTTNRADVLGGAGNLGSGNHGHDILASAGVRLPIELAAHKVEPFVRAIYQHEQRDGANEGTPSVSALTLNDYSASGTRFLAGLSGGSLSQDPLAQTLTYKLSAAVGTDTGSLIRTSVGSELAGQALTIQSPHSGREFGQLSLGGTVRVAKQGYLFIGADTEIAARRTSYGITGGVRVGF